MDPVPDSLNGSGVHALENKPDPCPEPVVETLWVYSLSIALIYDLGRAVDPVPDSLNGSGSDASENPGSDPDPCYFILQKPRSKSFFTYLENSQALCNTIS